MKDEMKSLVSN